ncbi:MAG TPA: hypothetical protein DCG54_05225 [Anaerolineae bacterium]|jgi:hypothetical protein|nr:hypothetical protein [Anaerolineae bacterium]
MNSLISFPLRANELGKLPLIPTKAYIGFFDASARRLVFVFDPTVGKTCLYVSTPGWNRALVIRDGLLPREIVFSSPLPGWRMACWKTVGSRFALGTGL